MPHAYFQIAATPSVKAEQERRGSRRQYERFDRGPDLQSTLGPDEVAFIADRDSFYQATVGENGWPYVQFRGGKAGFLEVLDERTLAYDDVVGNRQYVSAGNLATNPRVALILMDYARRQRLKIYARAEVREPNVAAAGVAGVASAAGKRPRVERRIVLHVEAFDWNCPQHITQRFTLAEIEAASAPLRDRIAALEKENRELRGRLEGVS
jgi:predicted pyridoxine 5'-phosphate oxidase superfamily flavin-nucleotide-binding protein